VAAIRAGERAEQCQRRLAELRERRPVGKDDVMRARASLETAQSRANVAYGRMLLRRARRPGPETGEGAVRLPSGSQTTWPNSLDKLRRRVRAMGTYDVFVAAFGIGGTTTLFDLEAFAHGLGELPELELRAVEHAVWELERF
jgi:hypothetical protein